MRQNEAEAELRAKSQNGMREQKNSDGIACARRRAKQPELDPEIIPKAALFDAEEWLVSRLNPQGISYGIISRMETPHSKFQHVYAIVRFDFPLNSNQPELTVSVVKIFRSEDAAEQEATRLNTINAAKQCAYKTFVTRLVQ